MAVERVIRVGELKVRPLEFARQRLDAARAEGIEYIDVLNRGRPIFHLGYLDDLPVEWADKELQPLPHVDIRKGRVSLFQLRRRGTAFLLTQREGEPLALWPLEEGYSLPSEELLPHRLISLENNAKKLSTRVRKLETTLRNIRDLLIRRVEDAEDTEDTEGDRGGGEA